MARRPRDPRRFDRRRQVRKADAAPDRRRYRARKRWR